MSRRSTTRRRMMKTTNMVAWGGWVGLAACVSGGDASPPGGGVADVAMMMDMAMTPPDLVAGADIAKGPDLSITQPVTIQILDISDWHGKLDPLAVNGQTAGGAAILSGYFKRDRMANPNTLTLTAGD